MDRDRQRQRKGHTEKYFDRLEKKNNNNGNHYYFNT